MTIDDVYTRYAAVRSDLGDLVAGIDESSAADLSDGRKWSIAQIIEHVAIVDEGMAKICAKLMRKAEADAKPADGMLRLSDRYREKGREIAVAKLEAPDIVQPVSGRTMAESLQLMDESTKFMAGLKPVFATYDPGEHTFPHPFFGPLTAHEWLLLRAEHAARHIRQIRKLMEEGSGGQ